MLSEETVKLICKLLEDKSLSQRAIARKLGVNRETVHRIATGKRFDASAYRSQKAEEQPQVLVQPKRCSDCGGLIKVIPCQLCKLRRRVREGRVGAPWSRWGAGLSVHLGINLNSVHSKRYLAVRCEKIRRGERPQLLFDLCFPSLSLGDSPMPVIANVKYIRWFLDHIDDLAPLLELPAQLGATSDLFGRWELIKGAGDLLVRLVVSFPLRETSDGISAQEVKMHVEAQGVSWERLLELLPLLVHLISLLEESKS
jgi:hypothetical protein